MIMIMNDLVHSGMMMIMNDLVRSGMLMIVNDFLLWSDQDNDESSW